MDTTNEETKAGTAHQEKVMADLSDLIRTLIGNTTSTFRSLWCGLINTGRSKPSGLRR